MPTAGLLQQCRIIRVAFHVCSHVYDSRETSPWPSAKPSRKFQLQCIDPLPLDLVTNVSLPSHPSLVCSLSIVIAFFAFAVDVST